jgi:hypothetical protein
MFEDVTKNNVHIGGFKRVTWEDYIKVILVLQNFFSNMLI